MPSFFVLLAVTWSLLYWVLGGVIFSIIALLKVGRIRRARFGCFFSSAAVGAGVLAAWAGLKLSAPAIAACDAVAVDRFSRWVEQFACGIIGIVGSFLGGFVLLLLVGAGLMLLSKSTTKSWIENGGAKEDHSHDHHNHSHHH